MSAAEALDGFEQALAVDHGEDADGVTTEFVDQAVAVEEALPNVGISEFRYDASEFGMRGQFVGKVEQTFDDALGVIG